MKVEVKRLNRVDWMKVIGMYVIILGHTFPQGLCAFIYSFSVPLFFFLSEFLNNQEKSWDECVRKVVYTLVLPYLLICVCNLFISFLEEDCSWSLMNIGQRLLYIIEGYIIFLV